MLLIVVYLFYYIWHMFVFRNFLRTKGICSHRPSKGDPEAMTTFK